MRIPWYYWLLLIFFFWTCSRTPNLELLQTIEDIDKLGKDPNGPLLENVYTSADVSSRFSSILKGVDTTDFESKLLLKGLDENSSVLRNFSASSMEIGDYLLSDSSLFRAQAALESFLSDSVPFFDCFKAYQLSGDDSLGNVFYTGYYTPVLKARRNQDSIFKYPIYAYPDEWEGDLPTREAIEVDSALVGMNLELAFVKNLMDIYIMQVQGSGFIEYPGGKRVLLSYAGTNRKKFRSIERYFAHIEHDALPNISLQAIRNYFPYNPFGVAEIVRRNPSYVFFEKAGKAPIGAATVPLTQNVSVAVDPDFIPLGAILLAQVPVLNDSKKFSHHELKIIIAQDVGGSIKGSGRIDCYMGEGPSAFKKANMYNHYGKLWLLLPKDEPQGFFGLNEVLN